MPVKQDCSPDNGPCAVKRLDAGIRTTKSKISILTAPSSSSQATYHLRRAFSFHCKAIVRSFCRSSLPNRTRSAGLRLGAALRAAVFALVKISVLTVLSTWWQSSLCDHVFLCLRQKRRHPPAPLLFLFKSNPLRRASIWILIQTDSHCIFF